MEACDAWQYSCKSLSPLDVRYTRQIGTSAALGLHNDKTTHYPFVHPHSAVRDHWDRDSARWVRRHHHYHHYDDTNKKGSHAEFDVRALKGASVTQNQNRPSVARRRVLAAASTSGRCGASDGACRADRHRRVTCGRGEIRNHEGFRPAGFQNPGHQSLSRVSERTKEVSGG